MLQTNFYDTRRFKNKIEAKRNKELYKVRYEFPNMVIVDPDGNETIKPLKNRVVGRLEVKDYYTLNSFLNKDMERREKEI